MADTKRSRAIVCLFVAALAGAAFVNCGTAGAATDESTHFYERAQGYLAKGELQSAIIELKNSVRADPANAAARYALGLALLKTGDAASAESQLKAAREHGFGGARVLEPLARALILQGEFQQLLDTVQPPDQDDPLSADIQSWRGYALMGLGKEELAEAAFQDAIRRDPKGSRGYEGLAHLLMRRGDLAAAERQIDLALRMVPDAPDALAIKGELRRLSKDPVGALPYFDKSIAANPAALLARAGRAALYLERGQTDRAQADVDVINKLSPASIVGQYLQALILASQHDLQAATNVLSRYSAGLDSYPPAVRLLGNLYGQQHQLEQAETYFRRYLSLVPGDSHAAKQLANLLLQKGQPALAIPILKAAIPSAPQDSQLMGLLAIAYLRNHQVPESGEWFDKATAAAPADPAVRARVGIGRFEAGEVDEAAKDLQAAIELNPDSTEARIFLVLADLRRKDFDGALAAAVALKAKMPDSPIPDNLRGAIEFAKGNRSAARTSFENALKVAPNFVPSQMNLAALDLADGQSDAAQQRYEAVVAANPDKAIAAMLALAQLELRRGHPDKAETWLLRASTAGPKAAGPQVALIDFYLGRHLIDKASAAALNLQPLAGDNLDALDALTRAKIAVGDAASTVAVLRRMTTLSPSSAILQDRLARALLAAGDPAGARQAFERAVSLDDDFVQAQLGLLDLQIRAGQAADAIARANDWRSRHPGKASGDGLVGAVLARGGRYDDAVVAFSAAVAKEASTDNVVRLYDAMLKAGKVQEAIAGLKSWVDQHPGDQVARFAFANALIGSKRNAEATPQYELLAKSDPGNPVILNNLAWLYSVQGDQRDLQLAQQAYQGSPNSPEIADTFGFILVQRGDTDQGLKLLAQAHSKAPDSAETTYHLAVALHKAGKPAEAQTLLAQLLASPAQFEGRPDAEILKKELDSHQ